MKLELRAKENRRHPLQGGGTGRKLPDIDTDRQNDTTHSAVALNAGRHIIHTRTNGSELPGYVDA